MNNAALAAFMIGLLATGAQSGEWVEAPPTAFKRAFRILDHQAYGTYIEPAHRWVGEFYSTSVSRSEADGYVSCRLIIAEDGSVSSAHIVEAIGQKATESDALLSLKHWRFTPTGTRSTERILVFQYRRAADPRFGGLYRKAVGQLQTGDLGGFLKNIRKLKQRANNLYEATRVALLDTKYAFLAKDEIRERSNLAILNRVGEAFLGDAQAQRVFRRFFVYQLKAGHLAAALDTYARLEVLPDDRDSDAVLASFAAEIERLREAQELLSLEAQIDYDDPEWGWPFPKVGYRKHTGYQYRLLRNSFGIEAADGGIETVAVRCEHGFMDLEAASLQRVTVPRDWGQCMLYFDGEPGARFRIIEYPAAGVIRAVP